ncbi:hypothetical protein GAMM_90015 [Gammaproteobacteria bacterium]
MARTQQRRLKPAPTEENNKIDFLAKVVYNLIILKTLKYY